MGLARTHTVTLAGVEGHLVTVEAQGADGLPATVLTGLADKACKQAPDRVRPALANCGMPIPPARWTINLSPAGVPKTGSGLDLGIAVAMMAAQGHVPAAVVRGPAHIGEIGLAGEVRPVPGVLPMVVAAAAGGVREVLVAADVAREAALVAEVTVHPVRTLVQVREFYLARAAGADYLLPPPPDVPDRGVDQPDLADVVGQATARAALEICAAGGHHLMLVGPPGAGKTMLAARLPGLLPALTEEQALAVTAIHSVLGVLPDGGELVTRPPFVAPHHSASTAAVIGGGSRAIHPGAVSRAHHGVLFLDESPEFRRDVLDALRQPLESAEVVISRADRHVRLPARFQLVLAANPCPCGSAAARCVCPPFRRRGYLSRLSGPLLDRVDLKLSVSAVTRADLTLPRGEPSEVVAARVLQARQRQRERWSGTPYLLNSQVPGALLRRGPWQLPSGDRQPLERAMDHGSLTLRGMDRALRVAWTIADLQGLERPRRPQVQLALDLRTPAEVKVA